MTLSSISTCFFFGLLVCYNLLFVVSELSFLERQQELAKQMWEDEKELQRSKGESSEQLNIEDEVVDEDEYDDGYYYYEDGYEDAYEDAYEEEEKEEIRFVPKVEAKRKAKGYRVDEESGFQDINKPITYLDLLRSISGLLKCHSTDLSDQREALKTAAPSKSKDSDRISAAIDIPEEDLASGKKKKLSFKEKQEIKAKERIAKQKEAAKTKEVGII